jgi:DNA-binding NarL/FixJ family response regulator
MSNDVATRPVTRAMATSSLVMLPAKAMINVSIVEDDAKLRATLERYLMTQPGFRCASVYPNAEAALEGIPKVNPDVVLMDINLPGMNGIECVARLRHSLPAVKIIMLTVFEEGEQVFNSLSAGAFGYLVKSSRPAKILEAIREVHSGGSPMRAKLCKPSRSRRQQRR